VLYATEYYRHPPGALRAPREGDVDPHAPQRRGQTPQFTREPDGILRPGGIAENPIFDRIPQAAEQIADPPLEPPLPGDEHLTQRRRDEARLKRGGNR
jgi:hypothetical protein